MSQIRKMLNREAEEVLKLWRENCLEATSSNLSGSESGRILAALQQVASHPQVFCLVVEEQSRLVGFLTARLTSHPVYDGLAGEIEELYIQPQFRRQGIGSGLVKQAVSLLWQQGASTIRVQACAESQIARDFWQFLGWEQDLAIYSLYQLST